MILYHGSYKAIEKPDISFSRDYLDFGRGFYTTPFWEQSLKWTDRFSKNGQLRVVSIYEFEEQALEKVSFLKFTSYSDEWLDFIRVCRRGEYSGDYDIVMGNVANDRVFNTLQLFFDGLLDRAQTIGRLRYEKPNYQYCFRSQETIALYLKYKSREVIQ